MTALSSFAEVKVLDLLFRNTAYTAPNAYLGLFTSDPTDSASGTEVSGNGYARIQIDNKMAAATTGSDNSSITSNSNITFAAASGGDFGTITHIGIFDALSSGNLLAGRRSVCVCCLLACPHHACLLVCAHAGACVHTHNNTRTHSAHALRTDANTHARARTPTTTR